MKCAGTRTFAEAIVVYTRLSLQLPPNAITLLAVAIAERAKRDRKPSTSWFLRFGCGFFAFVQQRYE